MILEFFLLSIQILSEFVIDLQLNLNLLLKVSYLVSYFSLNLLEELLMIEEMLSELWNVQEWEEQVSYLHYGKVSWLYEFMYRMILFNICYGEGEKLIRLKLYLLKLFLFLNDVACYILFSSNDLINLLFM